MRAWVGIGDSVSQSTVVTGIVCATVINALFYLFFMHMVYMILLTVPPPPPPPSGSSHSFLRCHILLAHISIRARRSQMCEGERGLISQVH